MPSYKRTTFSKKRHTKICRVIKKTTFYKKHTKICRVIKSFQYFHFIGSIERNILYILGNIENTGS